MIRGLSKWILLAGMVAALSVGVCGCSDEMTIRQEDARQESPGAEEEPEETEEEPEEQKEDSEEEKEEAGQEHISGDIYEMKDGSFVLDRYYEEELEDGALLVSSPSDEESEKNLETVFYDELTKVTHKTIYDGGARYDEAESSPEELTEGIEVTVYGQWKEDGFHAAKIVIIDVVL